MAKDFNINNLLKTGIDIKKYFLLLFVNRNNKIKLKLRKGLQDD